ncbi:flavodoxin [Pseudosulfitobacter sp. SM2401]|uniref:flavodoxin family protein n=1 Tax=Pseudosulfitobacter sp. SM2401 TaxID=3350098 RepID=UPI0036F2DF25
MKSLVLFYSRTGTTTKVANALGTALSADIKEIKCPRYQGGWFAYLRAGYDSVKGRLPPIDVPDLSFDEYDLVIIGAPIWTSYPALPLRSFLARKPKLPSRVAVFFTLGGHSPAEKAVKMVEGLLPVPLEASLELPHDQVIEGRDSDTIETFVAKLNAIDG